jgi:hypothetical protein
MVRRWRAPAVKAKSLSDVQVSSWENADLGPASSMQLLDEPGGAEKPGDQLR